VVEGPNRRTDYMGTIISLSEHQASTSFTNTLSKKPYCGNDLKRYGLKVRNREHALRHKYIQPNQPNSTQWLLFDIDYRVTVETITEDLLLPTPTIFIQNPKNQHAHVAYRLNTPIHYNKTSSKKPIEFLDRVQAGMERALRADASFAKLIIKNPTHQAWRTTWGNVAYDLDEFCDYCEVPLKIVAQDAGEGRNCTLFETLRKWAYRAIRQGWPDFEQWLIACEVRADGINKGFDKPLPWSEVKGTAKSVAKYTHKRFSEGAFSAIQSARQAKSVEARIVKTQDKREQAIELKKGGMTVREISELLSVGKSTVARWCKAHQY